MDQSAFNRKCSLFII